MINPKQGTENISKSAQKSSFTMELQMRQSAIYSGSLKALTVLDPEGPASSIFSSSLRIPASATFAMKSSSTRTLAVLKFPWIIEGRWPCK